MLTQVAAVLRDLTPEGEPARAAPEVGRLEARGAEVRGDVRAPACTPCATGTYGPGENGKGWSSADDLSQCKDCVAGKFSGTAGQIMCEKCARGKMSGAAAPMCLDCDEGYVAIYEGTVSGEGRVDGERIMALCSSHP